MIKDLWQKVLDKEELLPSERMFLANMAYWTYGPGFENEVIGDKINKEFPMNLIEILDPDKLYEIRNKDNLDKLRINIAKALATLSDREGYIITARFCNRKTLDELAKELKVTKERIRQLVAKTIQKLRHPYRMKIIFVGTDLDNELLELQKEYQEKINLTKIKIDELSKKTSQIEQFRERYENDIVNTTIDQLDLSPRTYNAVSRYLWHKSNYAGDFRKIALRDIIALTVDEVISIRNLGSGSFNELLSKLHDYGLKLIDEDTYFEKTKRVKKNGRYIAVGGQNG